MTNDLDDSWTAAEQLAWRQRAMPVMCGVSLCFSVIAQIVFHMFPRMREFPRSVISWVGYYNILWECYMLWKWSPGSSLSESWSVHLVPGTAACKGGIFLDNFSMNGFIACNTVITLTIFLIAIVKLDMKKHLWKVYCGYVAFVWIYPALMGLVSSLSFRFVQFSESSPCAIQDQNMATAMRIPGFIFLGIQILLIVSSLIYMKTIYSSVEHKVGDNFPMKYLIIRFVALYIAQLFNIFPTELSAVLPTHYNNDAIYSRFIYVTHAMGGTVDAIVLTLCNPDLMILVQKKFAELRGITPDPAFTQKKEDYYNAQDATTTMSVEMSEQPTGTQVDYSRESTPENDHISLV